jgi:signal peptidase I
VSDVDDAVVDAPWPSPPGAAPPPASPGARAPAGDAGGPVPTTWRWTRRVATVVILLALIAVLGIAIVALARGTWAVNPVLTGSMRPGIAVGGVVISEAVPVDQLHLRDVIVFRSPLDPSAQVVRRIVAITVAPGGGRVLRTMGDANLAPDPWRLAIPGGDVYRVRWSLPLLGYVAVAYEDHRAIALVLVGLVLLVLAIPTIARTRRRRADSDAPA